MESNLTVVNWPKEMCQLAWGPRRPWGISEVEASYYRMGCWLKESLGDYMKEGAFKEVELIRTILNDEKRFSL